MNSQYSSATIESYLTRNPLRSTDPKARIEELTERFQDGDCQAKDVLLCEIMPFVIKYASDFGGDHLPVEDKISCGTIGFAEAVANIKNFDASKGSFIAFAKIFAMRALSSGLKSNNTIRLSDSQYKKLAQIKKIAEAINPEGLGSVTDEEIAEEIDWHPKAIRRIRESGFAVGSLDAPAGDSEDSSPLIDMIADTNAIDPSEVVDTINPQAIVNNLLDQLPKKLKEVAVRLFGIGCDKETLEEIAKSSNQNAETIRLQGKKALKLMRQIVKKDLP